MKVLQSNKIRTNKKESQAKYKRILTKTLIARGIYVEMNELVRLPFVT